MELEKSRIQIERDSLRQTLERMQNDAKERISEVQERMRKDKEQREQVCLLHSSFDMIITLI